MQCLCCHACFDENGGNLTKVIHGCSHLVPCCKPNTRRRTGSFLKLVKQATKQTHCYPVSLSKLQPNTPRCMISACLTPPRTGPPSRIPSLEQLISPLVTRYLPAEYNNNAYVTIALVTDRYAYDTHQNGVYISIYMSVSLLPCWLNFTSKLQLLSPNCSCRASHARMQHTART